MSDGSQVYFDEWGKSQIDVNVAKNYVSADICKMLEKLNQKLYNDVDKWIIENEWKFNDELADIVKNLSKRSLLAKMQLIDGLYSCNL